MVTTVARRGLKVQGHGLGLRFKVSKNRERNYAENYSK